MTGVAHHREPPVRAEGRWILMPGDLASVPLLRHRIMVLLDRRAPRGQDLWSAELVVAELLSNAALHASTPTTVALRWTADHPLLSLTGDQAASTRLLGDEQGNDQSEAAHPPAMADGGRGLYLVTSLALGISVAHTSQGEQVDVTLDVARSA